MSYSFANAANASSNLQATYKGSLVTRAATNSYIKKLWSDSLRREMDEVSADLRQFIWTDSFGLGYSGGDTINIRTIGNLGVNDKLPGIPVTLQTTTMSSFPITLDRYIESSFSIEDIAKMLNDQGLIESAYLERSRYAIYKHIMGSILGMRAAFNAVSGSVVYATANGLIGGESRPLDLNHILQARTILERRNYDVARMVLLVTSQQFAQLLANQRIQNVFIKGGVDGAAVTDGIVGSIFGIPVRVTNFMSANSATGWLNGTTATPTPGAAASLFQPTQESLAPVALPTTWAVAQAGVGGAEVHTAMLVHKEAIAMAQPFAPTADISYETLYLMWASVNSYLYGVRSYRNDAAVLISSNGLIPSMTNQF
jgi:hypothetical protein